ncbi:hypothetical protein D3C71_1673830 [compost metagenome]
MFLRGFLISPAMKVTLFQASLENSEPTIAETTAANKVAPPMLTAVCVSGFQLNGVNTSAQLAFHTSDLNAKSKPVMISPKRDKILMTVSKV